MNPNDSDTDGDCVIDGRDTVPNKLCVDITYWEEKRRADLLNDGDPYFVIHVYDSEGRLIGKDKLGPISDKGKIENVPDDEKSFTVLIEVWDSDQPWSSDDHYDISEDLHSYDLTISYNVDQGVSYEKHDGSLDGSSKDLDGLIEFEITISGEEYIVIS